MAPSDEERSPRKGFWQKWGDNIASGGVGFLQRRIETGLEGYLLEFIRVNPWVRTLYETRGPVAIDILSMVLKGMPDPGSQKTFFGKLLHEGKDVLEIIPREIARILDERKDILPSGATPAGRGMPVELAVNIGPVIAQVAELDEADATEFLDWLGELNPRDRAFFWGEVAKWQPAERLAFMRDYDAVARMAVIRQFVPEPPSAPAPTVMPTRDVSVEVKKTFEKVADIVKKVKAWDQKFAPKKREPKKG